MSGVPPDGQSEGVRTYVVPSCKPACPSPVEWPVKALIGGYCPRCGSGAHGCSDSQILGAIRAQQVLRERGL